MENWLPVVGFEGVYEVSNLGRVKRVAQSGGARAGRILKQHIGNHGYLTVALCQDGIPKLCCVHRLVAAAFIGPCPAGHEVNHKNGNKTDPAETNLEYLTRNDNLVHSYKFLGRTRNANKGTANCKAKLSEQQVLEIRRRYTGRGGVSQQKLADEFGVNQTTVSWIVMEKGWRHLQP